MVFKENTSRFDDIDEYMNILSVKKIKTDSIICMNS